MSKALLWRGDDVVGIDNFNDYYPRKCKEFNVDLVRLVSGDLSLTLDRSEVEPVFEKIAGYQEKTANAAGSFAFFEADVVDYKSLEDIFSNVHFDAVVHLAAMTGVPLSTEKPQVYTQVNVDGTVNLLKLSVETGVKKFLFGSSSSVYGNREDKKVKEEDDVTKAVSIYGATKVAGEVLSHAYSQIFDVSVVVARIFGPIYGPLQRPYGMLHQRAINYLHNGKKLKICGKHGLETAKDATYIDDEVDGILKCLNHNCDFEIFNIGTSNPLPIKTWLDAIGKAYGKEAGYEVVDVDKADVVSSADISKARKVLGYNPRMDMYEGVKRQVEVFKLMPSWYQKMEV